MVLFTLFLLLALPAATATAIACEILLRRGKRPAVWLAIAAAFVMTPLALIAPVVAQAGWKALSWQFWEGDAKPGAVEILLPSLGLFIIGALLLSWVVVFLYQRRERFIDEPELDELSLKILAAKESESRRSPLNAFR